MIQLAQAASPLFTRYRRDAPAAATATTRAGRTSNSGRCAAIAPGSKIDDFHQVPVEAGHQHRSQPSSARSTAAAHGDVVRARGQVERTASSAARSNTPTLLGTECRDVELATVAARQTISRRRQAVISPSDRSQIVREQVVADALFRWREATVVPEITLIQRAGLNERAADAAPGLNCTLLRCSGSIYNLPRRLVTIS